MIMSMQLLVSGFLFLFFTAFQHAYLQEPECLEQLDFFIGVWVMDTRDMQRDGSFSKGRAVSSVYEILDGKALQDDFRSLNEQGSVVFRGTSIKSCLEEEPGYIITWIMPGKEGFTHLRAGWENGILAGEGEGYDDFGAFKERFEYYHISDNCYSFRMHRSYDNGKTWLHNFSTIEAIKKQ